MMRYALTTSDNPFDPFDQFDAWDEWDRANGYDTASYLARIVQTSSELPDAVQQQDIRDGIQEILNENSIGNYIMVSQEMAA